MLCGTSIQKNFVKLFYLNKLIREYNLIINNNKQKLFISVQTENNKNKI